MSYAKGKRSLSISDRSGQAFPYQEMVREWTGALVHIFPNMNRSILR
jgi:hypothetical protein